MNVNPLNQFRDKIEPEIKKEHPEWGKKEIIKEVADRWRKMPEEEREKFRKPDSPYLQRTPKKTTPQESPLKAGLNFADKFKGLKLNMGEAPANPKFNFKLNLKKGASDSDSENEKDSAFSPSKVKMQQKLGSLAAFGHSFKPDYNLDKYEDSTIGTFGKLSGPNKLLTKAEVKPSLTSLTSAASSTTEEKSTAPYLIRDSNSTEQRTALQNFSEANYDFIKSKNPKLSDFRLLIEVKKEFIKLPQESKDEYTKMTHEKIKSIKEDLSKQIKSEEVPVKKEEAKNEDNQTKIEISEKSVSKTAEEKQEVKEPEGKQENKNKDAENKVEEESKSEYSKNEPEEPPAEAEKEDKEEKKDKKKKEGRKGKKKDKKKKDKKHKDKKKDKKKDKNKKHSSSSSSSDADEIIITQQYNAPFAPTIGMPRLFMGYIMSPYNMPPNYPRYFMNPMQNAMRQPNQPNMVTVVVRKDSSDSSSSDSSSSD